MEATQKKTLVKTLKIIGNTLLWLFVAFAVIITILIITSQQSEQGLPTLFGKRMVNILTDSMTPTFNPGDLILNNSITPEESHNLQAGEIITFYADVDGDGEEEPGEIKTHRIVSSEERNGYTYYVTKGDKYDDDKTDREEIQSNKIIGVYDGTRIPALGSVMGFLQSGTGFLVVIVLPLVLFFLFELYNFISVIVKAKGKKISKDEEERIKQEAIAEYLRSQAEAASEDKPEDK